MTSICKTCGVVFNGRPTSQHGDSPRYCSRQCCKDYAVKSILGQHLWSLTILTEALPKYENRKDGKVQIIKMVECLCDCGKVCVMAATRIKSGHIKSCGCLKSGTYKQNCNQISHGLHWHPLNYIWIGVKQRCYNENNPSYHRYGGRGITVCDEWLNDFMAFYNWAMDNGWRKGLQVDRFPDNNGNYIPSNCRITTAKNNANNTSRTTMVEFGGERMALRHACDKLGIRLEPIYQRMKRNKTSFEDEIKRIAV